MKTWAVIYYNILRNLRDWKYMLILVIAPIMTTYLVGYSANRIADYYEHSKSSMAYFIDSSDPESAALGSAFEKLLQSEDIRKAFAAVKAEGFDKGYKMARDGDVDSFVIFRKGEVETYGTQTENPASTLIKGFMDSMSLLPGAKQAAAKISQNAVESPQNAMRQLDLWTYQNMIIFLFYGSIVAAFSIYNERNKNITGRVNSAPVSHFTNITGKIAGQFLSVFASAIFMIIFTAIFFGSNWNGNMFYIITALAFFSLFSVAFGTLLGIFIKRFAITLVLLMCLNMSLFMIPGITGASPHEYTKRIIVKTIYESNYAGIGSDMLILGLISVGLALICVFSGRLKKI